VLTVVLFAVLLAVAGAQSLLVQAQVRLDDVDKQLATEQDRYQQLRKDLAEMESPERIVAAAQAQGMVTPSDLVYLQPDDAGTAADEAAPADVARTPQGRWSDVKPLLEAPAP
jgi:cell division protein FtsL